MYYLWGEDMNFDEYQREALSFFEVKEENQLQYLLAGIVSELGELATLEAKYLRGDPAYARDTLDKAKEYHNKLGKELGDLQYFIAVWAAKKDMSLQTIALENLEKLRDRKNRGVIKGDGDNR